MGQLEEGENRGILPCLAGTRLQSWGSWKKGENRGNLLCLAGRLQPWDSWKRGKTGEICSAWMVGCSHGTAGRGGKTGEICSAWLVGCSHRTKEQGENRENLLCLAGRLQPSETRIKNIWPYIDKAHVCGHKGRLVWPNQFNR